MKESLPTDIQYLEALHAQYLEDADSVDPSWKSFFRGMDFAKGGSGDTTGPSALRIFHLIQAYRQYGHLKAHFNVVDPRPNASVAELSLDALGFKASELTTLFPTLGVTEGVEAPLSDIVEALEATYCSKTGFEYTRGEVPALDRFLAERIEQCRGRPSLSIEQKRLMLQMLNQAELFETFLHTKYVGQKRFSLEGGEMLIPVMRMLFERAGELGYDESVIGMAHRGRLNVLANILNKSYGYIFHEFEDTLVESSFEGSGDVKYHKGYSSDMKLLSDKLIHLSLAANPSHLEAVNPVVQGQTRAKQIVRGDDVKMRQIFPILIHGDASIAGQGVIYETLQLCNLKGYGVGGTIHIVVNNQIGFTTLPRDSRSTRYCTDIAKGFNAPVFHVNGEDAEGCIFAAQLAMEVRNTFGCDVFIDINCYRKYGHNEADEPAFTQPLEYKIVRKKVSPREIYRDELIEQGVVERQVALELEQEFKASLQSELDQVQAEELDPMPDRTTARWQEIRQANQKKVIVPVKTGVTKETLKKLGQASCTLPEGFTIHRKVGRFVEDRIKMVEEELPLNYAMAEWLAFATLLDQGTAIRLAGQDSRRATFNHRHAMWVDQEKEWRYFPLNHLSKSQGRFDVFNSPLSEYAALGFEYGYSLAMPDALTLWEAQFGDFANGAQIMVDQFIATSEQKWGRLSGLVLLLPHGYEGQGPEHSSARMERYLQLAGDFNMTICYPTTPAQTFHMFRCQVLGESRRPLIVFTPKSMLSLPACNSPLDDLTHGHFKTLIYEEEVKAPKTVVFCSGKVVYDLIAERERLSRDDVAFVRLEQLYPLDTEAIVGVCDHYRGFKRALWVQEEPSNMGAWDYIRPQLRELVVPEASYVGRPRSASPATGSPSKHKQQLAHILKEVFET